MMKDFQSKHSDLVVLAPSKTEGGSTDAIYANKSLDTLNSIVLENPGTSCSMVRLHTHILLRGVCTFG